MKTERRRVGRPPKIDRLAIAEAIDEVPPDELTMKRVADHLGVSLAGLYRYVNGRDELLRMAAAQTLARLQMPEERGQHWATWLREWAHYMHDLINQNRELVDQLVDSRVSNERVVELVGRAVGILERKGLDAKLAFSAFETTSALALAVGLGDPVGGPVMDAQSWLAWARIADIEGEALDPMRRIVEGGGMSAAFGGHLDECLTTVMAGIAVRAGLPVDDEVLGLSPTDA